MSIKDTPPGPYDNEWMVVTCSPEDTSVEFFETEDEAREASHLNTNPSTTAYVARVARQVEESERGTAKTVALLIRVDRELEQAIRVCGGARSGRKNLHAVIAAAANLSLETLRDQYRQHRQKEKNDAS